MVFHLFKGKAKEAADKFSGRTDLLEAAAAGIAMVAAADGDISDDEILAGIAAAKSSALGGAFSESQIEASVDKMLARAKNRTGRAQLLAELKDCQKHPDDIRQAILFIAADAADVGGIGDKEKAQLGVIASTINVPVSILGPL